MAKNCPNVRWVQASSAGIGQFMTRTHLDESDIVFTTAAGIHAIPLAEFALMSVLYFIKDMPALARWQHAHEWTRYTTRQVAGQKVAVVGLGQVGRRVVEVFSAVGADVWGIGRQGGTPSVAGASRVVAIKEMDAILPDIAALILCCPLTPETEGMIDERRLRLLPRGAIVVNIARGPVINEPALTAALQDGHLGGAGLDVFATEPLPTDSPLWDMDSVIVSPHSAATVEQENAVLTDLFCDNLRRWIDGAPLRNVYQPSRGY
jgi:glyoxylate/hydroxypyruvate reductase